MYTALLIVQLILGNFVVGSYIWLAFFSNISSEELEVFWAGLSPTNHRTIFYFWFFSMVLTVVSFLFSTYQFIFQYDESVFVFDVSFNQNRQYLLACYVVFLLSATAWAPLTLYSIRNGGSYKFLVIISLWLTALSCVGFAVFIFNTATNTIDPTVTIDSTVLTLLKIGAIIVVIHHVVLDATYWAWTFNPTEGAALLSIDNNYKPPFTAFIEERKRGDLSFI